MAENARLHVRRGDSPGPSVNILLDGRVIGRLEQNSSPYFTISPGTHTIQVSSSLFSASFASKRSGPNIARLALAPAQTFVAKSGGNYHCSWSPGTLTKPVDLHEALGTLRLDRPRAVHRTQPLRLSSPSVRRNIVGDTTPFLGSIYRDLTPRKSTDSAKMPEARRQVRVSQPLRPQGQIRGAVAFVGRREEPLGSEPILIDNRASNATINQRIEKSRQWTKSYSVDVEKVRGGNAGFSIGAAVFDIKADAEARITKRYMLSSGSIETSTHEVTVTVGPHDKVRIVLVWRQTFEYGVVRYRDATNAILAELPYQVAVGVTCDTVTS